MYGPTRLLTKLELTGTTGTQKVEFFPVECKQDVTVWLLDTPGFDDTHLSDMEVLGLIADWLKERLVYYCPHVTTRKHFSH